ncbi:hypothetical protein, partial [Celeribacter baekdonensis]|uniref:hypothetical protein n=1 Tax=Celeribacter baekdonensis TaxID=875171 RepID=UPI003A8F7F22
HEPKSIIRGGSLLGEKTGSVLSENQQWGKSVRNFKRLYAVLRRLPLAAGNSAWREYCTYSVLEKKKDLAGER